MDASNRLRIEQAALPSAAFSFIMAYAMMRLILFARHRA